MFKLGIFLFPLLTNSFVFFETCGFSYTTQTPCHSRGTTFSLFFNRFCHIEDNVQLGWGESWGMKFFFLLLMLSYFDNLVAFCLNLKFLKVFILLSMVIKEKFSKWKGRNWIFVFLLDLEFVLCLLKLMNYWNFYCIQL